MKPEIEVKFLDINHEDFRSKLLAAGGRMVQPLRQMRRAIMDYPDNRLQKSKKVWGWVRVRDESGKVTVTYKQMTDDAHATTHEIEYVASSYDKAVALFEAIGLEVQSEQYTRRESWRFADCDVELDAWPWLPPYVEIEGLNEAAVQSAAKKLGFDWTKAVRGSADAVYRLAYPGIKQDENITNVKHLNFDSLPDWLKQRQAMKA